MRRSDVVRRVLLSLLACLFVAGIGVGPAAAQSDDPAGTVASGETPKPTPEEEAQALKEARTAAGKEVCEPLAWTLPGKLEGPCARAAGAAFSPEGKEVTAELVCTLIVKVDGIPLLEDVCNGAVKGTVDTARATFLLTYKTSLAKLIADRAGPIIEVAKFVANPTGGIDDLANATKESTASATQAIFERMTETTSVDLGASWWQAEYARAAGLGLVVMTVLLLWMLKDVAQGKIDPDELATSVFALAPVGVILMMVSPSIGAAIAMFSDALTEGIAKYTSDGIGTFTGTTVAVLWSITSAGLPGGQLIGIVLFGLMLFGTIATLVGFIVQGFAMYASAVALGIAWGMMIHPAWRQKTRKLIAFWLATALMKPALMLTLGLAFAFLNAQAFNVQDGFGAFTALLTTGMILCLVGLSPWVLLKYIPLLPSGNEYSQAPSGTTSNAMAGAAAGAMSSWAMSRYHAAQSRSSSSSSASNSSQQSSSNSSSQNGNSSGNSGWRDQSSMPPPTGQPASSPEAPTHRPSGAGQHRGGDSGSGVGSPASGKGTGVAGGAGSPGTAAAQGGSGAAGKAGSAGNAGGGGAAAGGVGKMAGVAGIAATAGIGVANAGLNKAQQTAREFDPEMCESRDG